MGKSFRYAERAVRWRVGWRASFRRVACVILITEHVELKKIIQFEVVLKQDNFVLFKTIPHFSDHIRSVIYHSLGTGAYRPIGGPLCIKCWDLFCQVHIYICRSIKTVFMHFIFSWGFNVGLVRILEHDNYFFLALSI